MYTPLTGEQREKLIPELSDSGRIAVTDGGGFWLVKCKPNLVDGEKIDLLGWLLARGFANVAEVRLLNHEEIEEIKDIPEISASSLYQNISPENTWLVRLGSTYSLAELPCKTLESAVAVELVYSLLIRRRDVHLDNRVYVEGVPVFFDHQTAFLGEPELADLGVFFKEPPGDHGRASAWRVVVSKRTWTTRDARAEIIRVGQRVGGYHYVRDMAEFKEDLQRAVEVVSGIDIEQQKDLIRVCGFEETQTEKITAFLKNNQQDLSEGISRMEQIIYRMP